MEKMHNVKLDNLYLSSYINLVII